MFVGATSGKGKKYYDTECKYCTYSNIRVDFKTDPVVKCIESVIETGGF